MGLFSSKRSSTNVTDNSRNLQDTGDNAIVNQGNGSITVTDSGAIKSAFDFSESVADESFKSMRSVVSDSLSVVDKSQDRAYDFSDASNRRSYDFANNVTASATGQVSKAVGSLGDVVQRMQVGNAKTVKNTILIVAGMTAIVVVAVAVSGRR